MWACVWRCGAHPHRHWSEKFLAIKINFKRNYIRKEYFKRCVPESRCLTSAQGEGAVRRRWFFEEKLRFEKKLRFAKKAKKNLFIFF